MTSCRHCGQPEQSETEMLEIACRALCIADGKDPDEVVPLVQFPVRRDAYDKSPGRLAVGSRGPRWRKYEKVAEPIVTVVMSLEKYSRRFEPKESAS